eukprot:748571-Hanusia_phi.AAC.2
MSCRRHRRSLLILACHMRHLPGPSKHVRTSRVEGMKDGALDEKRSTKYLRDYSFSKCASEPLARDLAMVSLSGMLPCSVT